MYDGSHIVLLMLNFFARFYKELLFAGKLYVPVLPKYMGTKGDEVVFAYSDAEKDALGSGYDISYLKGLGELDSEHLCSFIWGKNRKLQQLNCTPEEYPELLEDLAITFSKTTENANARREIFGGVTS